MNALIALHATATTPLNVDCEYRFQSFGNAEKGCLRGVIVERASILSQDDVNSCLLVHPRWLGNAQISLKPAVITHRSGVFDRHADALYYLSNFRFLGNTPIHYDVLDVTKLEILFRERWPYIEQIFVSEAAEWIRSMIGKVAFTAVNEYMCHEGGHAVGFAVSEKLTSGFFRLGGRLRWPLIYMEEFRADTNSWFIASRILKVNEAVAVIIYTLIHRFGLAGQNLIEGSPGAGYVPYLHFYSLLKAGALLVKEDNSGLRLAFAKLDPSALLEAALIACRTVDDEINRFELNRNHEESADASLAFATARLGEDQSAKAFRQLFAMRPQR